jgi:Outer membrane protein beta-barrel domain
MKRLILFILASASLTLANAQIQFGLKAGANLANLSGSDATGSKMNVGFHGGGLVAIPVFSGFSVQPELVYSGQGAKVTNVDGNFTLNSGYLNIPVLFKYNHPSGFFAELGPQLGFLLSAKVKSGGTTTDVKSSYQSTDFSGVFGLGYLMSSVNLGIDARYNLGFTNLEKTGTGGTGTVKNGVIQIGVFYLFGKGPNNK